MNTNYAETGVRVGLRKVGNDVHLDLETDAGKASVVFDDTKSVYSALHLVKDELALLVSKTVDSILSFVHRTEPAPALPSLPITSEIDGAHAAALLEDEARSLGLFGPRAVNEKPSDPNDPRAGVALISAGDAAAVLDGKQVATPVVQPEPVPITTPTGEKPAA